MNYNFGILLLIIGSFIEYIAVELLVLGLKISKSSMASYAL